MERNVSYYSDGLKIAGVLYEPDAAQDVTCPGIVMCQGMIGIKEYFWFPQLGRRLASMGYVALIWDFRGVGDSEGEYGRLYPVEQAEDISNALTYLETNPKVDPERLALIGWSWGGGMVPYVAGVDRRVRCSVSIVGWGDGERWMRSLRTPGEWLELRDRIASDKRSRVLTGKSELIPLQNILGRDPSAEEAAVRDRIFGKIHGMENPTMTPYSVASIEKLLEFRPVEIADRISPRAILYIVAERDVTTPADDVVDMYERSGAPKKLWVIPGIPHYGVYEEPLAGQIFDVAAEWLREHLALE